MDSRRVNIQDDLFPPQKERCLGTEALLPIPIDRFLHFHPCQIGVWSRTRILLESLQQDVRLRSRNPITLWHRFTFLVNEFSINMDLGSLVFILKQSLFICGNMYQQCVNASSLWLNTRSAGPYCWLCRERPIYREWDVVVEDVRVNAYPAARRQLVYSMIRLVDHFLRLRLIPLFPASVALSC